MATNQVQGNSELQRLRELLINEDTPEPGKTQSQPERNGWNETQSQSFPM